MTESEARTFAEEVARVPGVRDVEVVHIPGRRQAEEQQRAAGPNVFVPGGFHTKPERWIVECSYDGPTKYWRQFELPDEEFAKIRLFRHDSDHAHVLLHGFLKPPHWNTMEDDIAIIKKAAAAKYPGVRLTFRKPQGTGADIASVTFYTDSISVAEMRAFASQFSGWYDDGECQYRYKWSYLAGPRR